MRPCMGPAEQPTLVMVPVTLVSPAASSYSSTITKPPLRTHSLFLNREGIMHSVWRPEANATCGSLGAALEVRVGDDSHLPNANTCY